MSGAPLQPAVSIAQDILNGRLDILAGCARLAELANAEGRWNDPDFRTFIAIESESDHLPSGRDREHWSEAALKRKDAETAAMAMFYRDTVFEACRRLVERFSGGPG